MNRKHLPLVVSLLDPLMVLAPIVSQLQSQ